MQAFPAGFARARIRYVRELLLGASLATSVLLAAQPPSPAASLSTGMDTAIRPGEDFFDYANGGWLKDTPIPPR
jgi:putative endopeptidase